MVPATRKCTKCTKEKPLEKFSKAPRGKYGRKASCKECDAARWQSGWYSRALPTAEVKARLDARRGEGKTCRKCGKEKPRTEFAIARQGKHGPILKRICKPCASAQQSAWAQQTADGVSNNRRLKIKSAYGLTTKQYARLLESQGGLCAVCRQEETWESGGRLMTMPVDHCHSTGRIRGVVCNRCNRSMGLLRDDPSCIRRAIDYLRSSGK